MTYASLSSGSGGVHHPIKVVHVTMILFAAALRSFSTNALSITLPHTWRHQRTQIQAPAYQNISFRSLHRTTYLELNRFLFDPSEISPPDTDADVSCPPTVTLPKNDYRTIHAAKILKLLNGDKLRAGIIQDSDIYFNSTSHSIANLSTKAQKSEYAGLVTDEAEIEWLPEGKIKKAQPTKNGDPPGSLKITLNSLTSSENNLDSNTSTRPRVSLILALPRPLALGRLLPMIAQIGVQDLVLTQARKVPKDYFGSHLFRKPMEIRKALIEGLCQAADVQIPSVTIVRRLKPFLEDDLDDMFPKDEWSRVIAHPQRKNGERVPRMSEISFAPGDDQPKRIVLAVGPEGGWEEPYELDMFNDHGFQQVTLGPRILRSDVAVISLLAIAQDVCDS